MTSYQLPALVDQATGARRALRRGRPVEAGNLVIQYQPSWLVRCKVTLRRALLGPRIYFTTVLVDGTTGRAEACLFDGRLLQQGTEVQVDADPAPAISLAEAERLAERAAMSSVLKRNHTFWLPVIEARGEALVRFPHWVGHSPGKGTVRVNAVTGEVDLRRDQNG
ncbi:MAG: hypothetical protein A2Y77_16960 [Planctomycetes bacterium RBG_13_62_9]|nr:MAG: hypothetical protein A2Y77_16960 [Planctomycetes bacterium RBG_13_62_9]